MNRKPFSQEALKILACATMLLDHIGISLPSQLWLRMVGRIAMPIFCFLLAEGIRHTKDPSRYCLRLAISMVLSEIPFDLAVFGGLSWQHQSVMVTLLLGAIYGFLTQKKPIWLQALLALPFMMLAEWFSTDYGAHGIAMIALFLLAENLLLQTLGLALICYAMGSFSVAFLGLRIPIEMFALLAMVPIGLYSGQKATKSKLLQWAFYLFYPAHLFMLALL